MTTETPLTPETIRELRELLSKATQGPWVFAGKHARTTHEGCGGSFWDLSVLQAGEGAYWHFGYVRDDENAALIVAMKNNIPALLSAAERALRYEAALGLARQIVEGSRRSLYVSSNENGLIPYAQIDMLIKQSMIEYDLLISKALTEPQQKPEPEVCETCGGKGGWWTGDKSYDECPTCGGIGKKEVV